jgi:hypothetical protein
MAKVVIPSRFQPVCGCRPAGPGGNRKPADESMEQRLFSHQSCAPPGQARRGRTKSADRKRGWVSSACRLPCWQPRVIGMGRLPRCAPSSRYSATGAHRRLSPQVVCIQHFTADEPEATDGPSAGRGWGASHGAAGPAACHLWYVNISTHEITHVVPIARNPSGAAFATLKVENADRTPTTSKEKNPTTRLDPGTHRSNGSFFCPSQ